MDPRNRYLLTRALAAAATLNALRPVTRFAPHVTTAEFVAGVPVSEMPLQVAALEGGLALLAGAQTDEDQRCRPGLEVDLVDLAAQRRRIEHRSDAQHVARIRHVGLKLLRQRDDRARAGVVDVAEPFDCW